MTDRTRSDSLLDELRHLREDMTQLRVDFAESVKERSYVLKELQYFRQEFMLVRVQNAEEADRRRKLYEGMTTIQVAQAKLATELRWRYGLIGAVGGVIPACGVAIYFLLN